MSDIAPVIPPPDETPPPEPDETPEETMARLRAEDTRPRFTVTKAIDLALLSEELGVALSASGAVEAFADPAAPVVIVIADSGSSVTQAELEAAIKAHVPPPPPPPLSERIDDAIDGADDLPSLKAALKTLLKDELA